MSDSLKARVGRVIAGGFHALLDKAEDHAPEAVMEQAVRELDQVVDDTRHEWGKLVAQRHLAQQQHGKLNQRHHELGTQTQLALSQGREDLARAAVARQIDIEAQIPILEETLAEQLRQEQELGSYIQALQAKRREMLDAIAAFRQSRTTAETGPSPTNARTQERVRQTSDAFDRLYERHTGLGSGARQTSLLHDAQLQELEQLQRDHRIAERLVRIKAEQV